MDEIKRQITLKEGEEGDEEKAKKFLKHLKNSYDSINSAKLNLEPGSTLDNYEQILIDIENKIEDIKNEILSWKK